MKITLLLWCLLSMTGCGLLSQGIHQQLPITSDPLGARVTFRSKEVTTPATLKLNRRYLGDAVARGEKEGYYPSCQIVSCGAPRWIKVLDSIPAAIPLLIDLAAGSLFNCDSPSLVLEPLSEDAVSFVLPADDDLLTAFYTGVNVCRHAYLFDSEFAAAATRIIVTTGGLQRHYSELGPVDFSIMGSDVITGFSIPIGQGFRVTSATRTFSKAKPEEVNEALRRYALRKYGKRVDAVINVDYQTNPRNDVDATGLAVQFVADEGRESGGALERLDELQRMRDRGLISEDEFQSLRTKVLQDVGGGGL